MFFPLGLWLPRNGAEASVASRSAVQRQPKRAPMRGRTRGLIPKWSPNPSGAPTPRNTNWASCRKPRPPLPHRGGIGALLRREGLYSSLLATWRRERANGILEALTPQKRGPKSKRHPMDEENQKLRRQNARLTEDLRKAHIIIDVQKKVAALLGHPIPEQDPEEES